MTLIANLGLGLGVCFLSIALEDESQAEAYAEQKWLYESLSRVFTFYGSLILHFLLNHQGLWLCHAGWLG